MAFPEGQRFFLEDFGSVIQSEVCEKRTEVGVLEAQNQALAMFLELQRSGGAVRGRVWDESGDGDGARHPMRLVYIKRDEQPHRKNHKSTHQSSP